MNKASLPKNFFSIFQPAVAWIALLGFVCFTLLCLATGMGRILNLAFPAGAFAVGLLLYARYPILYLGFTWWIWFLTPVIRRLSDSQNGFTDPSPILLSPYLVTLITLWTFIEYLPRSKQVGNLPFVISTAAVFYGYLIGLIQASPVAVSVSLLEWLTPISLGHHLFVNWRMYLDYRQNMQRVFLWFTLLAGAYGVFQYLVAPEWDKYWLTHMIDNGLLGFGRPEPLMIRVWSTMHSPGVFAFAMAAALLLLFSNGGVWLPVATVFGYLSFLLSQGRSAWLIWATGLLLLFPSLQPRLQIRLVITFAIMALCVVPLITAEPFSEVVNARVQTFSNLEQDTSAIERQEIYEYWLKKALVSFIGGGTGGVTRSGEVTLDSAVLDLLLSLGWFGTLFYVGGLAALFLRLLLGANVRHDPFSSTARAIAISVVCQLPLGSVMLGFQGIILWSFLGIGIAAQKYDSYQRSSTLLEAEAVSLGKYNF
ncbi:MAG: O-antigen ligase domain-containing protein [Leptolyngbyaceae cyanobacterium SM1_3_5]|nr:O-antigen ligase domain-containing protein [Leptolyngbyaceae cyanobacterium SM1_3_5]